MNILDSDRTIKTPLIVVDSLDVATVLDAPPDLVRDDLKVENVNSSK